MKNWNTALESYGTPKDFADDSYFINVKGKVPLTILIAPGYANRAELMKQQREATEKRKQTGASQRWKNDGEKCFLCDNVGQAEDIGNNLLLPFDAYTSAVLVPNRYAAMRGHTLVVEKNHQEGDLSLDSSLLATAVELAEKYKFGVLRNHPKSGMSIPGHDHFHTYPKTIKTNLGEQPLTQIVKQDLTKTDFLGDGMFRIKGTRFDTLAFNGKKSLENMLTTIRKLEEKGITFTFYYHPKNEGDYQGTYFLTPHMENDGRGGAGFGIYLDVSTPEVSDLVRKSSFMEAAEKEVYTKGDFSWGDIIC